MAGTRNGRGALRFRTQSLTVGCDTFSALAKSVCEMPARERWSASVFMPYSIAECYGDAIAPCYAPFRQAVGVREPRTTWERIQWAVADARLDDATFWAEVSPTRVAKLLGISQPSVSNWSSTTNPRNPAQKHLRSIALMTDVCVEWLSTGREPKRPFDVKLDDITRTMVEVMQALDTDERARLLEIAVQKLESPRTGTSPADLIERAKLATTGRFRAPKLS